jgi:arylsulfatase I/J
MTALISGNYKILMDNVPNAGWAGPVYPNNTGPGGGIYARERCGKNRGCLYNIINDPGEHNNLASQMPRKLKKMRKKLGEYRATHFNPYRGEKSPAACEVALNDYGGFWGPFIK